jgi:hypothetical protein
MVNQTIFSTRIWASAFWNDVGPVREGRKYEFEASGKWLDWFVPCHADGYDSFLLRKFEKLRRVPDDKWFCLIGALDREPSSFFRIGNGGLWTAPRDGFLSCFANDLPNFYWNNFGSIPLLVHELG